MLAYAQAQLDGVPQEGSILSTTGLLSPKSFSRVRRHLLRLPRLRRRTSSDARRAPPPPDMAPAAPCSTHGRLMGQAEATVDTSSTEDASGFEAALAALDGATSPTSPPLRRRQRRRRVKTEEKDEETKSFQALRRQRAKLRAERERLAEERASWERERHQSSDETRVAKADAAMLRELRELAKTDRAAVLERLGISYEDLTTDVVGRDTPEAAQRRRHRNRTERGAVSDAKSKSATTPLRAKPSDSSHLRRSLSASHTRRPTSLPAREKRSRWRQSWVLP